MQNVLIVLSVCAISEVVLPSVLKCLQYSWLCWWVTLLQGHASCNQTWKIHRAVGTTETHIQLAHRRLLITLTERSKKNTTATERKLQMWLQHVKIYTATETDALIRVKRTCCRRNSIWIWCIWLTGQWVSLHCCDTAKSLDPVSHTRTKKSGTHV